MTMDIISGIGGFCIGWIIAKSTSSLNLYIRDENLRQQWNKDIEISFAKKIPVILNQDQQNSVPNMPVVPESNQPNTNPAYIG